MFCLQDLLVQWLHKACGSNHKLLLHEMESILDLAWVTKNLRLDIGPQEPSVKPNTTVLPKECSNKTPPNGILLYPFIKYYTAIMREAPSFAHGDICKDTQQDSIRKWGPWNTHIWTGCLHHTPPHRGWGTPSEDLVRARGRVPGK